MEMKYQRKAYPHNPMYEIDTMGNVYSLRGRNRIKSKDGTMSPRRNTVGYYQIKLYSDSKKYKDKLVHRLVWETFIGDIPEGMTVDHIDNDNTNNRLDNLQLMTLSDNIKKAWDNRGRSKKKKIVLDWIDRGYTRTFIANELNVSESYISMIVNGKR
jgi:hypothetical protein